MKYFLGEYLGMANSGDINVRKEGAERWDKLDLEYARYFKSIEERLPKMYVKTYMALHGFHDCKIKSIHIANAGKNVCKIEFILEKHEDRYLLLYSRVKRYKFDVPADHSWHDVLCWGYDELELNEDGSWTNRILCDQDCELEIIFQRIHVKKIK